MNKISLCCQDYEVIYADKQLMFISLDSLGKSQFTFEWKGLGWYLVDFENEWDSIYLPHIVAAFKWTEDNYQITWINGVGQVNLLSAPF